MATRGLTYAVVDVGFYALGGLAQARRRDLCGLATIEP